MEGQPNQNETCGICYDKILTGKVVKTLDCKHKICKECYNRLKTKKCPYCRKEINIPSIYKEPILYYSYQEVNEIRRYELPETGRSVDSYLFNMGESSVGRRINRRNRKQKGLPVLIDDYRVDLDENDYYEDYDEMIFELELS